MRRLLRVAFGRLAPIMVLGVLGIAQVSGQSDPSASPPDTMPNRGFYPSGSYSINDIEAVNNVTGNLMLSIPLAQMPPGPGGTVFGVSVVYNSAIFDVQESISGSYLQALYVPSKVGGWRYAYEYELGWDTRPMVSSSPCADQYYAYKAYITMPDGSRRNLRLQGYFDNNNDSYYALTPYGGVSSPPGSCGMTAPIVNSTLVYFTVDGSYIRVEVVPAQKTWTVFLPNGTQVKGTSLATPKPATSSSGQVEAITDRNGNTISIAQSCPPAGPCTRTITDGFSQTYPNRTVVITYNTVTGGLTDTITWPGAPQNGASTTLTASIDYVSWSFAQLNQPYRCLVNNSQTTCNTNVIPSFLVAKDITLPPAQTGATALKYLFDNTCQGCVSTWGEVHKITMPSGAVINYSYAWDTQASTQRPPADLFDPIGSKTVSYSPATGDISASQQVTRWGWTPGQTVVTAPDNSTTTYSYSSCDPAPLVGLICDVGYSDSTDIQYVWAQNPPTGNPAGVTANPYVQYQMRSTVNQKSWNETAYLIDLNGNITEADDYDWFLLTNKPSPTRKTVNTYVVPGTSTNGYWNTTAPHNLQALQLTQTTNGSGVVFAATQYGYDSAGNPTSALSWDSTQGTGFTNPLTTSNAIKRSWTYTLNGNGNLVTATDPNGNVSTLSYGADTLYPTGLAVAGLRSTSYIFDPNSGHLLSSTDDNGVTTIFTHDLIGRLTKSEQKVGLLDRASTTTYDDSNLLVTYAQDMTTTGDQALVSKTYFDPLGRVRLTVDPAGNSIKHGYSTCTTAYCGIAYEVVSNPYATTSDPSMGWTLATSSYYTAPSTYRLRTVQHFSGATPPSPFGSNTASSGTGSAALGISTASVPVPTWSVTDEAGRSHSYTIDGLGRLSTADGTGYGYDVLDNLLSAGGRTFTYTSLSRLLTATNPESGRTKYGYDKNGNLVLETDARTVSTCFGTWNSVSLSCDSSTYGYDGLNRPRQTTYSDATPMVSYLYDQSVKGTLWSVSVPTSKTTYAYDQLGRITGSTQMTNSVAYPFSYVYNLADFQTSITYPSGRTVGYTPDTANRVSAITSGATTYAGGIQYSAPGAIYQMKLGNNLYEATDLNGSLQPTAVAVCSGQACAHPLQPLSQNPLTLQFGYASNNNGNVQSQTITEPSLSVTQNYTYDSLNRIFTAAESGSWSQTFGYVGSGNRWVYPSSGYTPSPFTPTAQSNFDVATNRLMIQGSAYDAAGNQTQIGGYTSAFDAEGRMTSNQLSAPHLTPTTYGYDGAGQRVTRQDPRFGSWVYVYDAHGNLAAEYTGSTPSPSPCVTPTCYVSVDQLGSTRLVTNSAGGVAKRYDYLPFGEELPAGTGARTTTMGYQSSPDGFNPKFTGQVQDIESGLYYFNARYYGADQGRFVSGDPIAVTATRLYDPAGLNLYSYTRNRPLFAIDQEGLETVVNVITQGTDGPFSDIRLYSDEGQFLFEARGLARGGSRDRMADEGDTPFGKYEIQQFEGGTPKNRSLGPSYGTGKVDLLELWGEVIDAKRDQIRIHGGGRSRDPRLVPDPYAPHQRLIGTHGCARLYNEDVNGLIEQGRAEGLKRNGKDNAYFGSLDYLYRMAGMYNANGTLMNPDLNYIMYGRAWQMFDAQQQSSLYLWWDSISDQSPTSTVDMGPIP